MDIDRRVPIVDPTTLHPKRSNIPGMPGLGYSAAWYDGNALVVETSDIEPGYVSTMQEWAGLPQSRMMRTIERFTRTGDLLTIQITHVDPAMYRDPLIVTITVPQDEVRADGLWMQSGRCPGRCPAVACSRSPC